jgi:hypothetical protein
MTLGALRKVNDVPESWQARIAEHDYSISMLRALEGDAWRMSALIKRLTAMDRPWSVGELVWRPLWTSPMRLMASNYSETLRKMVSELKGMNPCFADPAALDGRGGKSIARWNVYGRMAMPSLDRAWWSAVEMALEAELTLRVLAARAAKQKGGDWPAELPGLGSAVCPGVQWAYSTSNDGSVSLSLSKKPVLGKALAFRSLPLTQGRTRLTPPPRPQSP